MGPVGRSASGGLTVGGREIPECQGTAAMLAAAHAVLGHLRLDPPQALLGADRGRGNGTRAVHALLPDTASRTNPTAVAFHYLQPVMTLMRHSVRALERSGARLIADAGGMYAAKAAGIAAGVRAHDARRRRGGLPRRPRGHSPGLRFALPVRCSGVRPHPARSQGVGDEGQRARAAGQGAVDHVCREGRVVARIAEPCVPELEPIGGTGDTITGISAALIAAGFPAVDAAVCAARANREAGRRMQARPDHRAEDLVRQLPAVLADNLCDWSGACSSEGGGA